MYIIYLYSNLLNFTKLCANFRNFRLYLFGSFIYATKIDWIFATAVFSTSKFCFYINFTSKKKLVIWFGCFQITNLQFIYTLSSIFFHRITCERDAAGAWQEDEMYTRFYINFYYENNVKSKEYCMNKLKTNEQSKNKMTWITRNVRAQYKLFAV